MNINNFDISKCKKVKIQESEKYTKLQKEADERIKESKRIDSIASILSKFFIARKE